MKNKYILKRSDDLLSWFRANDMFCFDYKEAFKALPNSKESAVREFSRWSIQQEAGETGVRDQQLALKKLKGKCKEI